jgi:acyl dehydratase
MKYNLATGMETEGRRWRGPGPRPEFGPSPGFKNLKWLKPVYAGETVSFTRTGVAHRPIASRRGWRLLTLRADAFDSTGDKVLEFESAVLVKVG